MCGKEAKIRGDGLPHFCFVRLPVAFMFSSSGLAKTKILSIHKLFIRTFCRLVPNYLYLPNDIHYPNLVLWLHLDPCLLWLSVWMSGFFACFPLFWFLCFVFLFPFSKSCFKSQTVLFIPILDLLFDSKI